MQLSQSVLNTFVTARTNTFVQFLLISFKHASNMPKAFLVKRRWRKQKNERDDNTEKEELITLAYDVTKKTKDVNFHTERVSQTIERIKTSSTDNPQRDRPTYTAFQDKPINNTLSQDPTEERSFLSHCYQQLNQQKLRISPPHATSFDHTHQLTLIIPSPVGSDSIHHEREQHYATIARKCFNSDSIYNDMIQHCPTSRSECSSNDSIYNERIQHCSTVGSTCFSSDSTYDEVIQDCSTKIIFPKSSQNSEVFKTHQCEVCLKTFKRASSLSNHRLIHKSTKTFKCDHCSMSFLRKSDLGKHVVIHSGKKPYSCETCGKRFSQSSNMLTHQRRHSGIRPYSCTFCGKSFYRKVDVRRHSTVHRGF